jgi:radical SAM superfamily enzyme YgiQ (UPF0313 family)
MPHHALIFNVSVSQYNRPGGAHRIASLLRENDWDVEVCDWADDWQLEELQEFAKSRISTSTKFIGFSCFFDHWSVKLDSFVEWIRQNYSTMCMIRGGQVAPKILYPAFKLIDYHVAGYGEVVIMELVKKILGTGSGSTIPFDPTFLLKGIKLIDSNKFFQAWPLYNPTIIYENRDFVKPHEWLSTEFSRGCKFKCPYCNFPVLGAKGDFTRDAENFDYQLRHAYDNWGVTNYFCADETFNDRTEKIIKFADVVEKFNFVPFFSAFVRADLIVARPQDWEHFLRLGVLGHFYGIESFNHDTSKLIGKGMNFEKLTNGLIESKNYWLTHGQGRYRGTIAQVVGLPKETKDSLERGFQWIRNNWQGQSYIAWPLEISKNTTIDRESAISKDYQKYGYSECLDEIKFTEGLVQNNFHMLNWKNEHFTFQEAIKICAEFESEKKDPRFNYTVETFELGNLGILGTIDRILTYTQNDRNSVSVKLRTVRQRQIQKYINKKLSN